MTTTRKLSEAIDWRWAEVEAEGSYVTDGDCRDWLARSIALEAEVERLRESCEGYRAISDTRDALHKAAEAEVSRLKQDRVDTLAEHRSETLELKREADASRAKLARVKALLNRGPKYWAHADEFHAIIDGTDDDNE